MKKPLVVIVILNWNGLAVLKDCLSSLYKRTDYKNFKVLVTDNGSVDGSVEFVKKHYPKAGILQLDKNYGVTKGFNKGMRYAIEKYNPKYVLMLGNDTEIIQKEWLSEIVKCGEMKHVGMVGCKLLYSDGKIQHAGGKWRGSFMVNIGWGEEDRGQYDENKEMIFVNGTVFLINTDMLKKVGVLDEIYSPYQCEETDLSFRAAQHGYKTMYCGKAKVIHKESISMKKTQNTFKFYIDKRNNFILIFRWFKIIPKKTLPRDFLEMFATCFLVRTRSGYESGKLKFRLDFPVFLWLFIKAFFAALFMYKRNLSAL